MEENKTNKYTENSGVAPIVFFDKTGNSSSEDILGSIEDARIISKAIDDGAEMIAVTSAFGAGKSTVIDLLSEIRKGDDSAKSTERIVKVSLWSQASASISSKEEPEISRKEMHRHLLYQVISQLDSKQGTKTAS